MSYDDAPTTTTTTTTPTTTTFPFLYQNQRCFEGLVLLFLCRTLFYKPIPESKVFWFSASPSPHTRFKGVLIHTRKVDRYLPYIKSIIFYYFVRYVCKSTIFCQIFRFIFTPKERVRDFFFRYFFAYVFIKMIRYRPW